jgi:Arc/MetJ-type ribon-helix-helix transcriptional regulator
MTIHLPKDVESSINAAVHGGQFSSVDEALAEAWRTFQRQKPQAQPSTGQGSIGAMRDAADELDEIVADAMKKRQGQANGTETVAPARLDSRPIWEVVDELRQSVPAEEWDKLPVDGAEQLDHYLYGSPKRPTA